MHVALGAIDRPVHESAVIDTPAAVPLISASEISSVTLPVLVTVTLADLGVAPTVTDPKSIDEGVAPSVLIGVTLV